MEGKKQRKKQWKIITRGKKLAPKPADVLYYWEGFIHNFGELAYFIHRGSFHDTSTWCSVTRGYFIGRSQNEWFMMEHWKIPWQFSWMMTGDSPIQMETLHRNRKVWPRPTLAAPKFHGASLSPTWPGWKRRWPGPGSRDRSKGFHGDFMGISLGFL